MLNVELGIVQKRIRYTTDLIENSICAPLGGLVQTLLALIRNALDASDQSVVTVSIDKKDHSYIFSVIDTGSGINTDIMTKVTDPFYTTKEPGKGMGLGLFLTKLFVDRVHGDLEIESTPGKETVVSIIIPQTALKKVA